MGRLLTTPYGYRKINISSSLSSFCFVGPTLDSLFRKTTPPCPPSFSSPSLSFSPFSHFTHLPPDALLIEMESQAQLLRQLPPCQNVQVAPRRQDFKLYFQAAWRLGTSLRVYRRNYNRGSASSLGPTGRHWRLKKKKKDRDRNTLNTANSLRVHSFPVVDSRQNLGANQSN